jgi:arylsulfatase A-like enzyme
MNARELPERPAAPRSRWRMRLALVLLLAPGLAAARAPDPGKADGRPSIVLIVVDTLRADAVSAYGAVAGTTPVIDALAAEGILYSHAYASSSWTLPSHATLLSGLRVDEHRAGMPGRAVLQESVVTLAERLRAVGYETVGLSENILVSDVFNLLQGFDHRRSSRYDAKQGEVPLDAVVEVRTWLKQRQGDRPFFLFVNLIDAHVPYTIRDENPFVPPTATAGQIGGRAAHPHKLLCGGMPGKEQLEILWGLYLGDVAAADAKAGKILADVRKQAAASELISIITSDHGEFFGERKLLGHEFGLGEAVLHIPLIVHGLPGVQPAVVDRPVELLDVAPSVLEWAGVEVPSDFRGSRLPNSADAVSGGSRVLFAAYSDRYLPTPEDWQGLVEPESKEQYRQFCAPSDPVFGSMATLVRYPLKFHWFEKYPPELYDLSWDPAERSNQAKLQPDVVEQMTSELEPFLRASRLEEVTGDEGQPEPVSQEVLDALRELGYVE